MALATRARQTASIHGNLMSTAWWCASSGIPFSIPPADAASRGGESRATKMGAGMVEWDGLRIRHPYYPWIPYKKTYCTKTVSTYVPT